MDKNQNSKQYDLEKRTLEFSKNLIHFLNSLPKNNINNNLVSQVIRSGTSVGANYREANETETKKDFVFRVRICRKEAKESVYWLELIKESNPNFINEVEIFKQEASEFVKIFAAIALKAK